MCRTLAVGVWHSLHCRRAVQRAILQWLDQLTASRTFALAINGCDTSLTFVAADDIDPIASPRGVERGERRERV